MRTELYFRNLVAGSSSIFLNSILQVLLRWVFIKILGAEYLGLSGLFTNILAMLSLVDLGIGTVIGFSLYGPLSQKDYDKVASLIRLYKNIYSLIAVLVLGLGLATIPFLPFFLKNNSVKDVGILFVMTLLTTVSGYFFSYNQALLNADQRGYVGTRISMYFGVVNSLFLIVTLVVWRSYLVYLIVTLLLSLILQGMLYYKVKRMYAHVYRSQATAIPKAELSDIVRKIKGMLLHRFGDVAVNSTDGIIISKFVSVASVGYFSNYFMMLSLISRFMETLFHSMVASVGQLLAERGTDHATKLFGSMNFLCFWLYGTISITFFCSASQVVHLIFGSQYVLSPLVVGLLSLNFYVTGMRIPSSVIKSAAGVFVEDKYVPLIQAFTNLGVSIIAVQYWGMAGVFFGTFVSSILPSISRPYVACKYGLSTSSKTYFLRYLHYLLLFLAFGAVAFVLCEILFPSPNLFSLSGRVATPLIIFNASVLYTFWHKEEALLLKAKFRLLFQFLKPRLYV